MAKQAKSSKRKKHPVEKGTDVDPDIPRKGHLNEYLKKYPPPKGFLEGK